MTNYGYKLRVNFDPFLVNFETSNLDPFGGPRGKVRGGFEAFLGNSRNFHGILVRIHRIQGILGF